MYRTALTACLLVIAAGAADASTHVVVQPKVPPPDNLTQPALLAFMRTSPSPTIVLRVPAPQGSVTQSQGPQGSADLNQGYLAIEKELVKAGFTVRDRGLLQEILRSNQNLDYRSIQQKIDAQLILEIVSLEPRSYNTDTYVDAKSHRDGQLKKGEFHISGWHFDSRLVMVATGEIGGIYTVDVVPQGMHFIVSGSKFYNATPQGRRDDAHTGYGVTLTQSAPSYVSMLLSSLRPNTRQLGVRVAPITPEIVRELGFKIPKKTKGVIVVAIEPNSRAEAAGLRLGDVIENINGQAVQAPEDVVNGASQAATQPIALTVNRGGKQTAVKVPAP